MTTRTRRARRHVLCITALLLLGTLHSIAGAAELLVWTNFGPTTPHGQALAALVERFNAEHPDIKVTLDVMSGNFEEKVVLAYTTGVAPDVIIGGVARYALEFGGEGGMFLPLDGYIDGPNGFPRDAFVPDMWVNSIVDGKAYQLALDGNERALIINADAALAAGLDVTQPEPVRNWDDLLDWARKLTRQSGDETVQWGFHAHQQNGGDRLHWMWLNGGRIWSDDTLEARLDDPRNVEALRFAADMIHTYRVAPAPGGYSGTAIANFRSGRFAMIIGSSNNVEALERDGFNFITVAGPPGWGEEPGRFSGATSSTIQIMSSTQHPDEAWTFVRYLAYERASDITAYSGIPYLIESLQDARFQRQPWQAFVTSIMTLAARNHLVKGLDGTAFFALTDGAWTSVMRGEKDAEIALKEANGPLGAMRAEWGNR